MINRNEKRPIAKFPVELRVKDLMMERVRTNPFFIPLRQAKITSTSQRTTISPPCMVTKKAGDKRHFYEHVFLTHCQYHAMSRNA